MTIGEAMVHAQERGIRRPCWLGGLRIRWNGILMRWCISNEIQELLHQRSSVDMLESQGLFNPASLCATDWEAA